MHTTSKGQMHNKTKRGIIDTCMKMYSFITDLALAMYGAIYGLIVLRLDIESPKLATIIFIIYIYILTSGIISQIRFITRLITSLI